MSVWKSLSSPEKIALVKRGLLDGLSIGLIAARAGAPEGSVATLIHRHHLRTWLRDEEAARARAATATGALWRDLDRAGRIAAIRAGIADGLTTSAIARRHGATRSAICGAASRAGIRFSAAPVIDLAERREGLGSPAAAPAADAGKGSKPPAGSDPPAVAGRGRSRPAPAMPAALAREAGRPDPEPARAGGRGMMELGYGQCRYPLWGDQRPDFGEMRFCAAPVVPGTSWCAEHRKICIAGRAEIPKSLLRAIDDARRAGR